MKPILHSSRVSVSRIVGILSLTLVLAGCGFSLRGGDAISDSLPSLALNLQQPNDEIARLLRRALEDAGVELSEATGASESTLVPVLSVGAEQSSVVPVSLTPRARAAQYDVRLALTVGLTQGEQILFGPEELVLQRVYYEDTDTLSGNREEVQVLQSELRAELVNGLLRRLEAVAPSVANR